MNKSHHFVAIFCLFLVLSIGSSVPVKASTVTEQMALLERLAVKIEQLQSQLLKMRDGTLTPKQCLVLNNPLHIDSSDYETQGEVSKLQRFLSRTGDYTYGEITGFYGPATMAAVQLWQAANGVVNSGSPESNGFGLVGKLTREALVRGCYAMTESKQVAENVPEETQRRVIYGDGGSRVSSSKSSNSDPEPDPEPEPEPDPEPVEIPLDSLSGDVTLYVADDAASSTAFTTIQEAVDAIEELDVDAVDSVTILLTKDAINIATTIDIDNSISMPLTIRGDGPSGKTTLTSSTAIPASSLEDRGDNIYALSTASPVYGVVIGGELQPQARISVTAPQDSDTVYTSDVSLATTTYPTYLTGNVQWRYFSCPIASFDDVTITIDAACAGLDDAYFSATHGDVFQFNEGDAVVNHPDALTENGDWVATDEELLVYLDTPGSITVFQKPLDSYIHIHGITGNRASDVTLDRVSFINGGAAMVTSYATQQSGFYKTIGTTDHGTGAVLLEHADNITITNAVFKNLTEYGVRVIGGGKNISITDSQFSLLGAGGVAVGESARPGDAGTEDSVRVFTNIAIDDDTFFNTGLLYTSPAVVSAYFVQESSISNNNINKAPYTGISLGWGWRFEDTNGLGSTTVDSNVITNVMHTLHDGAGIYTLSNQPGTVISNNIIQYIQVGALRLPIYLDKGSSDITVRDNIIRNTTIDHLEITTEQPIFGPDKVQAGTPCGFKACDITLNNNVVE